MSNYYFLINDTKKERVALCGHVKESLVRNNPAVSYAIINYMMDNRGDIMHMEDDRTDDWDHYNEIDLLQYKFTNPDVIHNIINKLNDVYGCEKYRLENEVGIEIE